ncbi:MAG: L-aspartate oxidase, partial [Nanoarchaeota archaeon]
MKTDFLVIGSGLAGLYFSLNASKYGKCLVITKNKASESNTKYAQGGIAAVFGKEDSFESHIKDTLKAGSGLCNEGNVKIMAENAPKEIKKLLSYGVKFDKANGDFELGKEGAHSFRRILHHKDATGLEMENKLVNAARKNENIEIKENSILIKLLAKDNRCYGALFLDANDNSLFTVEAGCIILATGGIGQVYKYTTNPKIATGDGIAAAYDAGAEIENMEFVQFHPTALNAKSDTAFLISESLRGEGAFLINENNGRFVKHNLKELAPRDILSREIFNEMKKNKAYLDISHKGKEFIKSRFPNIYSECLKHGIDITKDKIPIFPAAHFLCGGIKTDSYSRTTIKNLFAIGECACTGVHGANRLASNSLLECLVFSARAAEKAKVHNKKILLYDHDKYKIIKLNKNEEIELAKIHGKIKKIMWEKAGITRTKKGLKEALMEIKKLEQKLKGDYNNSVINKTIIETKSMIAVAKLIIEASLRRNK